MRRLGKVRFFRVKAEVERLLSEGYTLISIFERLEGYLEMSHRQFRRYVADYITLHRKASECITWHRRASDSIGSELEVSDEGLTYSPI